MNLRVLFFFAFLSASMLPAQQSFRFLSPQPGCVMRVLKSANASVSVLTNGGDAPVKCQTQHRTASTVRRSGETCLQIAGRQPFTRFRPVELP
jgi:hypothetical protein